MSRLSACLLALFFSISIGVSPLHIHCGFAHLGEPGSRCTPCLPLLVYIRGSRLFRTSKNATKRDNTVCSHHHRGLEASYPRRSGGLHMHSIRSAMPDARLKPFVRCFAQREISGQTSALVETALATLEHVVSFCFSGQSTTHHWSGTSTIEPRINVMGTQ